MTMDEPRVNTLISRLLGFNAGYVDTAGFLALSGLFTAHVTGNFVTLGAALMQGGNAISKLAALPVFCAVVLLTRLSSDALVARGNAPVRGLIAVKVALLLAAALVMISQGPFADADKPAAVVGGMLLVAAMAVQNAMQRMHMGQFPPSALMTGNTTQVMIDLADLLKGAKGDAHAAAAGRMKKMLPAIVSFAVGCALAALAYVHAGMWCFAVPPVVALAAWAIGRRAP